MAKLEMIKKIIDELEVIATAFTGVNFFEFDELSAINSEDRSKTYPGILVNGQGVGVDMDSQLRSGRVPANQDFPLRVFFFDKYDVAEQKTKTLQEKYNDLLTIAIQYFAEVGTRTFDDSAKEFNIKGITGGLFAKNQHNDQLVQLSFNVEFSAKSTCTAGTFNY